MRGVLALGLLLALAACAGEPPGDEWSVFEPPPLPAQARLANPERGFYATGLDLFHPDEAALAEIEASGVTLVYPYDAWLPKDRDLTEAELLALKESFNLVRAHGLKLVLRFRYSEEGDAPLDRIRRHLGQVLPVVRENADLVYVFQAGFLGRWGEWHCWRAKDVCHDDPESKQTLLDKLVKGLPDDLPIAVRYPPDKVRYLGLEASAPPPEPIGGRLAHHNDCWLAGATDNGTYPEENPGAWRRWVYAENDRLPYGGETCAENPPRTDGENALKEAEAAHLDYLNREYHEGLLRSWQKDGTYTAFAARLGYRLELVRARWPKAARAGARVALTVTVKNVGFSRLKRPRPAYLVFRARGRRVASPIALDLTKVGPGEARRFAVYAIAPQAGGRVEIGLWFPDRSPRLQDDPRYAIRLASTVPFDAGVNWLGSLTLR